MHALQLRMIRNATQRAHGRFQHYGNCISCWLGLSWRKPAVFLAQALVRGIAKAQLREKRYSDYQIEQMKPAEAHQILGIE